MKKRPFIVSRSSRPVCRRAAKVAAAYRTLLKEFGNITALAHGEMFELTDRPAATRHDV